MVAPVWRLKKTEIVWLQRHRCRHHHTYLEHYTCYLEEVGHGEKLGFFDIETTNLDADYGIMLCYCIKEAGKKKIQHKSITKQQLETCLDEEVVKQCMKDLLTFDRIVTYYGTRFDIPFLRTRCLALGLDCPLEYGIINHKDIFYVIRGKFKLHRNRLENACRTLLGDTQKTHIKPEYWIKALQGDETSLRYILDHCKRDVRDLEKLYYKVIGFHKRTDKSI